MLPDAVYSIKTDDESYLSLVETELSKHAPDIKSFFPYHLVLLINVCFAISNRVEHVQCKQLQEFLGFQLGRSGRKLARGNGETFYLELNLGS